MLAVFTICVLSLGLTKGAFAVMSTINTYSGVWAPLMAFQAYCRNLASSERRLPRDQR